MTPAQRAAVLRRRPSLDAQVQAALVGKKAVMLDMTDLSTLRQDSSAIVDVVSIGNPIGAVIDKAQAEQDKTATFAGSAPDSSVGSTVTKSGAVVTFASSPSGDEIRYDAMFAATDTYTCCEFVASGSGQMLVYAGGSPVIIALTGSPTAYRAAMTNNASTFLIFRSNAAGTTGTVTVTKVAARKGNHATQSTAGLRPLLQTNNGKYAAQFDGTDDALILPNITWTGGALNSFVASNIGTTSNKVHVWRTADPGGGFWGVWESGNASNATGSNAGSPTYAVNGVAVSPSTRAQLYTMMNSQNTVLESIGVTLSASSALQIGGYTGAALSGPVHRVLLVEGALTAPQIALFRTWTGQGIGLNL